MSSLDWLILLPELILTGVALFVLIFDLRPHQRSWLVWMSLLGAVAALIANELIPIPVPRGEGGSLWPWQGMIRFDELSRAFNLVFLLGCGLALMFSAEYLGRQGIARGEYYALVLLSTLGAMLMGSSANLLMLFLGLEVLSIPLYILATFLRHSTFSQEAGLKYFLLGAFSSALFLYGIALVYGATGTTQLDRVIEALSGHLERAPLLYAGAGLLLVGLGFKAAAVPFHTWAPDVYEGAPTSATAFMAVAAKAGAFAALLRVFALAFPALAPSWTLLIAILAIITMVFGNVVAVVQTNLKRLLAYSSISHAGYLLIAICSAQGLLLVEAESSLLFYLLVYTLMTLGAFGVVILMEGKGENLSLEDLSGLAARQPWAAAAMAVFMISLAGLPPTAGFFAKFYLFRTAIQAGGLGLALALVGVLTSVVSVYYYLRVVYYIYMRPLTVERPVYASPLLGVGLALAAIGVLLLGVYPRLALGFLKILSVMP